MNNVYDIFTGKLIELSNEKTPNDAHYEEVVTQIRAFYELKKIGAVTLEAMEIAIPWFEEYSLIAMTQHARDTARQVVKNLKRELSKSKVNF